MVWGGGGVGRGVGGYTEKKRRKRERKRKKRKRRRSGSEHLCRGNGALPSVGNSSIIVCGFLREFPRLFTQIP